MQMRSFRRGGVVALPVLLAACASRVDYDPARPGFYLGAGGLYAIENFDMDEIEGQLGADLDVDDSWGANGKAGFRLHPNFGVEGDFSWLDEFQIESDASGNDVANLDGWAATANLKAYLATGPVQPFAFAGLGALRLEVEDDLGAGIDEDETDLLARFGAGFDFYLTENLAIYTEGAYNLPTDDLEDFDFITVTAGLLFRF